MNLLINYLNLDLIQQIRNIDAINIKVKFFLPENLKAHCTVGSFERGCLNLIVYEAVWATELRYLLPQLRDDLRQKAGLYQLSSIKLILGSKNRKAADKPSKKQLSIKARQSIEALSKSCQFEPLKAALENLAKK